MALWDKYQYRPGLTFGSKTSAHIEIIRPRVDILASSGVKTDEIRELIAEFGTHNPEYVWEDGDGHSHTAPDIRGHFFNLDQKAEQDDWTQEEVELAAKKLLYACDRFPGDIWLHSRTPAARPWAKYDDTPYGQIVGLAEATGTVAEALTYEQENKKRKSVVDGLTEALAKGVVEAVDVDSLTAA